jgi:hypothetical protein
MYLHTITRCLEKGLSWVWTRRSFMNELIIMSLFFIFMLIPAGIGEGIITLMEKRAAREAALRKAEEIMLREDY